MHYNCKKRKFRRERGCKYKEKQNTEQAAEPSNMVAPFRFTFLKISSKIPELCISVPAFGFSLLSVEGYCK